MSLFAGMLATCKPKTQHEKDLAECHRLIWKERLTPLSPETGVYLPKNSNNGGNDGYTLIAGVWVSDRLYWEALGVKMGSAPSGDDVSDRNPGIPESVFGSCGRCGRSWKWVNGHSTSFGNDGEGCFPLCERCWKELGSGKARLPYYRQWHESSIAQLSSSGGGAYINRYEQKWPLIEKAVLEGK